MLWYENTQVNEEQDDSFVWQDRFPQGTLGSGFDDYPRAMVPNKKEIHLDLQSWIVFFRQTLMSAAEALQISEDVVSHKHNFDRYNNRLQQSLYDNNKRRYADFVGDMFPEAGLQHGEKFNHHNGLINLFPLMLSLIEEEERIAGSLDFVFSEEMVSDHGLRTLSRFDQFYHKGSNYWRGNVWVVTNYLALRGIYVSYMQFNRGSDKEDTLTGFKKIRDGLVNSVYTEWARSGYFMENFDDRSGEGLYNKAFSGWTTLVLNVLSNKYT